MMLLITIVVILWHGLAFLAVMPLSREQMPLKHLFLTTEMLTVTLLLVYAAYPLWAER